MPDRDRVDGDVSARRPPVNPAATPPPDTLVLFGGQTPEQVAAARARVRDRQRLDRCDICHARYDGAGGPTCHCYPPNPHRYTPPQPDPNPGGDMTAPTTHRGPSNVDVLSEKVKGIGRNIGNVDVHVDDLAKIADALEAQVREGSDFATSTGQATATNAAMDAARAMVAKLRAAVATVSQAAAQAAEQTRTAQQSLQPTKKAQDDLESTGATGDAVATATAA